MRGIAAGAVLSIGTGWLIWVLLALYLILAMDMEDSVKIAEALSAQDAMLRLMPVTFVVVFASVIVGGRLFEGSPLNVALGVVVLTAASITPPFAIIPSIHGNYIPIAAAGLAGFLLLQKLNKAKQPGTP